MNIGLGGAEAAAFSELAWSSFAAVFALRLINPMDGALGEEPGWRGFALPRMQATRSPLHAAVVLSVLVAGWHLPLVMMGDGDLAPVGLLSTFRDHHRLRLAVQPHPRQRAPHPDLPRHPRQHPSPNSASKVPI